jgi:hypothetical protein
MVTEFIAAERDDLTISRKLKQAVVKWWERHICAEDPYDRAERLHLEQTMAVASQEWPTFF